MKTSTFTFFNHAGGVGKTSATRDFGFELTNRGYKVLLVDFDAQGNLTSFLGADKSRLGVSDTLLAALMEDRVKEISNKLPNTVSVHGMDLYPATIDLARAEVQLIAKLGREQRLANALSQVPERYDYVLIDSPPSLGTLTINALVAADAVISPVTTSFKAIDGLPGLMQMIDELRQIKPSLEFAAFLPTMYDQRNRHDVEVLESLKEQLSPIAPLLPTLRYRPADHKDASIEGKPVGIYSPSSHAAKDMRAAVDSFLVHHAPSSAARP